jgi:RNA polymerase sigma-70 factor (ECF subfamily)
LAGREQFEVFWDRTRDPVTRAVALTVGDVQLAAEATDEAMVRAYQRWDRVGGLEDPAGWVYRVACNWATSWRRKMMRRPTRDRDQLDRVVSDAYPDLDLIRAVQGLATVHRQVIVLRFYLDWPVARIATALDIAEGTVKSRLHRALIQLRECEVGVRSDA